MTNKQREIRNLQFEYRTPHQMAQALMDYKHLSLILLLGNALGWGLFVWRCLAK